MTYLIFDLVVLLALAASILTVAGHGRFGLASGESRPPPSIGGGVAAVASGAGDADAPPTTTGSDHCVDGGAESPPPKYNVGDIVEVFDPKIHPNYSFHAKIENIFVYVHENDNSCSASGTTVESFRYDVRPGFGPIATYERLDASSIRPMAPFEAHSRAMCDEGRMLNARIVPCTVDSHVPNSKNFFGRDGPEHPWLYSMSLSDEAGGGGDDGVGEMSEKRNMPVTRIRRIIVQEGEGTSGGYTPEGTRWKARMTPENSPQQNNPAAAPSIPQESTSSPKDDTFRVGSVIEIYGPGGYFAFPATVTGVTHGTDEHHAPLARYDLLHGITQNFLKDVDPQFVHPYEVYSEGQDASCNVGNRRKVYMVPCTVLSVMSDEKTLGNSVVYQVRVKMVDGDGERVVFLPRLRVQRRIRGRE